MTPAQALPCPQRSPLVVRLDAEPAVLVTLDGHRRLHVADARVGVDAAVDHAHADARAGGAAERPLARHALGPIALHVRARRAPPTAGSRQAVPRLSPPHQPCPASLPLARGCQRPREEVARHASRVHNRPTDPEEHHHAARPRIWTKRSRDAAAGRRVDTASSRRIEGASWAGGNAAALGLDERGGAPGAAGTGGLDDRQLVVLRRLQRARLRPRRRDVGGACAGLSPRPGGARGAVSGLSRRSLPQAARPVRDRRRARADHGRLLRLRRADRATGRPDRRWRP